jgi:hypothetical protein
MQIGVTVSKSLLNAFIVLLSSLIVRLNALFFFGTWIHIAIDGTLLIKYLNKKVDTLMSFTRDSFTNLPEQWILKSSL